MTEPTLYDNDAVLKLSAYRCWDCLSSSTYFPPAIVGVASFSLRTQAKKKIKRGQVSDPVAFNAELQKFLDQAGVIEPTEDELVMAADLEQRAVDLGGELDSGESQLIAVLVTRMFPYLVTGDKRAVKALALLAVRDFDGRIVCLERALRLIVEQCDWAALRSNVCSEKAIDTACTMAFGCHSSPGQNDVLEGLDSYIRDFAKSTGCLLAN